MLVYVLEYLEINIFFSSIANLKCTPSDRQMYPRLGTPLLTHERALGLWQFLFKKPLIEAWFRVTSRRGNVVCWPRAMSWSGHEHCFEK